MVDATDTYVGTQEQFMRDVYKLAEAHATATNHDPEGVMCDLAANILSLAMSEDDTGELIGQIMQKAHGQAAYFRNENKNEDDSEDERAMDLSTLEPQGSA